MGAAASQLGFTACFGVSATLLSLSKFVSGRKGSFAIMRDSSFKVRAGEAEGTYDAWAARYEQDTEEVGFASPWACARATAAVAKDGARLLDMGCGTGLVGKLCLDLGLGSCSMDGSDLSQEMLAVLVAQGRTTIYRELKKHDLAVMPWPFEAKAYDVTVCNGVLIYVEQPAVLDEFVRVTRRGGHCVIMFRSDGYPVYEARDKKLRQEGKWRLVSQTEPAKNFPKAPASSPSSEVTFSIYTYQVLV